MGVAVGVVVLVAIAGLVGRAVVKSRKAKRQAAQRAVERAVDAALNPFADTEESMSSSVTLPADFDFEAVKGELERRGVPANLKAVANVRQLLMDQAEALALEQSEAKAESLKAEKSKAGADKGWLAWSSCSRTSRLGRATRTRAPWAYGAKPSW